MRKGVQDVGQQQFLMLLLVMQSDFHDRRDALKRGVVRVLDQRGDRGIDMRAVGGDLVAVRAREQPAHRTRMARAGGDIIGIEQEGEAIVERLVAGAQIR